MRLPTPSLWYAQVTEMLASVATAGWLVLGLAAAAVTLNAAMARAQADEPGNVLLDGVNDVTVQGSYAYLTAWYRGLRVVDTSDPRQPREVSFSQLREIGPSYEGPAAARKVIVADSTAYVNATGRLHIVDVADPLRPKVIGSSAAIGGASALAVGERYMYAAIADAAASGGNGWRIIDVSDPANPRSWFYDTAGRFTNGVAVSGRHLFVAVGGTRYESDARIRLLVFDVSDPALPVRLAEYVGGAGGGGPLLLRGRYAFMAAGRAGLSIFDISDPARPIEVGSFVTPAPASGLAANGRWAYVTANWPFGSQGGVLYVIDVTEPMRPRQLGSYVSPSWILGVAARGNYTYLATYEGGLRILDVSDPWFPRQVFPRAHHLPVVGKSVSTGAP